MRLLILSLGCSPPQTSLLRTTVQSKLPIGLNYTTVQLTDFWAPTVCRSCLRVRQPTTGRRVKPLLGTLQPSGFNNMLLCDSSDGNVWLTAPWEKILQHPDLLLTREGLRKWPWEGWKKYIHLTRLNSPPQHFINHEAFSHISQRW